ncbi:MAG: hypothetical protein ABEH64_05940 [Salinirussus sp.]
MHQDAHDTGGDTGPVPRRYRSITEPDGTLLIYDDDAGDGWVRSDEWISVGAIR